MPGNMPELEIIKELLELLEADRANKEIDPLMRYKTLYIPKYLDALVELSKIPGEYATICNEIDRITKWGIKTIKIHVKEWSDDIRAAEAAKLGEAPERQVPPEITARAMQILKDKSLVDVRRSLVAKRHHGDEVATDLFTYTGNSEYIDDPIHADLNGDPEIGKTDLAYQSLRLFPEEDVLFYTNLSPKYVYYESLKMSFKNKIMYLDDVGPEHIGILKVLRNETDIPIKSGTVGDKESLNLQIDGHPVVYASSVLPLRDLGGQGTSRSFLMPIEKPSEDEEKKVHTAIRKKVAHKDLYAILKDQGKSEDTSEERAIIEAERYLRDKGILRIGIPFDAPEPDNVGRRDTGKFVKVIKTSAFMHQFKRPILYIGDDKVVLAIQEDISNALNLYQRLGLGHELRVTPNGLTILKVLSDKEDEARGSSDIRKLTDLKDRTIQDNLRDLFDADLVYRKQIVAPGNPFVYWISADLREKLSVKITVSLDDLIELRGNTRKIDLRKYGAKYSSDSLNSSIYSFFDELSNKNIEIIRMEYFGRVENGLENIIPMYLEIFAAQIKNEPKDSDESREWQSAQFAEIPDDSGIENPSKDNSPGGTVWDQEFVVGEKPDHFGDESNVKAAT